MKHYRTRIFILFPLLCLLLNKVSAQETEEHLRHMARVQKLNYDRILTGAQQLQMGVIPEIKRISVVGFDYSRKDISEQAAGILKTQLELGLSTNGYQVVNIPEFKMNPVTFIQSQDSLMRIIHQKPVNRIRSNGDSLLSLTRRYAIQGYIDCYLAYDVTYGYMLSIQLTNANTREIVAHHLLLSNYAKAKSAVNSFQIDIGLGNNLKANLRQISTNTDFTPSCNFITTNFTWRQSFNSRNSGYFGITGGVDLVQTLLSEKNINYSQNDLLAHAGIRYYISLLPRNKDVGDYYLEFFQGIGMINGRTVSLQMEQGFNFNISRNLGLLMRFNYLFSPWDYTRQGIIANFGNTNLSLHSFYRF